MIISKFGGTSLGDAHRISEVVRIIEENSANQVQVVVLSAMGKTTDHLNKAASYAEINDKNGLKSMLDKIATKHMKTIKDLNVNRDDIKVRISDYLTQLKSICDQVCKRRTLLPPIKDQILSFGERLIVHIVSALLNQKGVKAKPLEADSLILTDSNWGFANPQIEESNDRIRRCLEPLLREGVTPILTGFIGGNSWGEITTLGRGGSDYTASLVGCALDCEEIIIYTDVDGVMTADPQVVPNASRLPFVSYEEMAGLAIFGADMLHPKSITTAWDKKIPIRIKNTFNLGNPGTLVSEKTSDYPPVKAVTSLKNYSLLFSEGQDMYEIFNTSKNLFKCLERNGANPMLLSYSPVRSRLCFVFKGGLNGKAPDMVNQSWLKDSEACAVSNYDYHRRMGIISLVGSGLKKSPHLSYRIFSYLEESGICILSLIQTPFDSSISFIVEGNKVEESLSVIHDNFLSKERIW